jgi:hypothetical protein
MTVSWVVTIVVCLVVGGIIVVGGSCVVGGVLATISKALELARSGE